MNDRDIQVLAGRLNTGWALIAAEPDDAKRARLEDHWIVVLRQYESACDQAARVPEGIAACSRSRPAAGAIRATRYQQSSSMIPAPQK